jgi:hypothetical protein
MSRRPDPQIDWASIVIMGLLFCAIVGLGVYVATR